MQLSVLAQILRFFNMGIASYVSFWFNCFGLVRFGHVINYSWGGGGRHLGGGSKILPTQREGG